MKKFLLSILTLILTACATQTPPPTLTATPFPPTPTPPLPSGEGRGEGTPPLPTGEGRGEGTPTPTPPPTPTETPTPDPYAGVDFANPATFPAEYQNYQPGLSEQKDLGYHTFLAHVMVEKMTQNPDFLENYGAAYGIDTTTLQSLTDADLQNYETYRDKVLVPYLRMIHEAYQNGGEYQPLPFDQWAIEQMLQSKNPVASWLKDDGTASYGFSPIGPLDKTWFDRWNVKDNREAQEKYRGFINQDPNDPDIFRTTINGREITASRWNIKSSGDMKAINLGYMDMPGYPNTLILIAGAFDENGNWYLQPFVVNHGRTPLPDGKVWLPTVNNTFLGWLSQYKDLYEQASYNRDELLATIGHVVYLSPFRPMPYSLIKRDAPLDELTEDDLVYVTGDLITVNGFEAIWQLQDGGIAPEYPDLQPVP